MLKSQGITLNADTLQRIQQLKPASTAVIQAPPAAKSTTSASESSALANLTPKKTGGHIQRQSDEDLSTRGMLARLARLCEQKKDSGKIKVVKELHDYWANAGPAVKLAMGKCLAACNWQKDG